MALKQSSAFAVYKQLKEEDMKEPEDAAQVVDEVSVLMSRKRKKGQPSKNKKKQKLLDNAGEDVLKSKKKAKRQLGKNATEPSTKTKKKKLLATHRTKKEINSMNGVDCAGDADDEDVDEAEFGVHIPFRLQFKPEEFDDSREAAKELVRLIINPAPIEQFFGEIWEQKPLIMRRHQEQYNSGWFSSQDLDTILRENDLEFGTNIDITTYEDGQRRTHNPEGRAHVSTVWEFFQSGCSVRLLNPATYSKSVWLLNSTLQEHFNSCVGANIYLTPANSQGFAPHYDDIEAFILQLEGRKHWRVYMPKNTQNMLPQHSSGNFSDDDDLGTPVIDTILEPGDLLYFPRGFIHQANTLPESHSLHITVSTYQKYTWGTVLEKLLPSALKLAMTNDVDFRRGLPMGCTNYMGILNSDKDDPRRIEFWDKISKLMGKLSDYAEVETAVDEVAMDNVHSSLPPVLTESEKQSSVVELGARWNCECEDLEEGIILKPDTKVRLIRSSIVRLVVENGEATLYHTLQNSMVYQEKDLIGMQIHEDDAPAVEYLINVYPEYVAVHDLPIKGSNDDKVDLSQSLYSHGLLMLN